MVRSIFARHGLVALAVGVAGVIAAPGWASTIYMGSGNTVYQFDGTTGLLLHSGQVDTTNVQAEGLAVGPDGKVYAGIGYGGNRVVSFNADLTGRSLFVTEGQGGLFTSGGADFGTDGSLYVVGTNQQALDRYQGPDGATPGANEPSAGKSGAVFSSTGVSPLGLAIAGDGAIYVSRETNGGEIDYIDSNGVPTAVVTALGSNGVGDIAISGNQLFVRDSNQIYKYLINLDHTLTSDPSFHLVFTEGTAMDGHMGLTFGEGGFLYADERSLNSSPGLNSTNNTDWIVRINPSTGSVSRYVVAGLNSFNTSDPNFLTSDVSVPEPSAAMLGAIAVMGMAMRRRRRTAKV